MDRLSKKERLYQEALTAEINEVAYRLDCAGLRQEGYWTGYWESMQEIRNEENKSFILDILEADQDNSFISKITGFSSGKLKKIIKEIALDLLKKKNSIPYVSKVTKLSESEITKLKNTKKQTMGKLSRDEQLYQETLAEPIKELAYQLDRAGLRQEGLQKVALIMLDRGLEASLISKLTSLSQDEILKLKK